MAEELLNAKYGKVLLTVLHMYTTVAADIVKLLVPFHPSAMAEHRKMVA